MRRDMSRAVSRRSTRSARRPTPSSRRRRTTSSAVAPAVVSGDCSVVMGVPQVTVSLDWPASTVAFPDPAGAFSLTVVTVSLLRRTGLPPAVSLAELVVETVVDAHGWTTPLGSFAVQPVYVPAEAAAATVTTFEPFTVSLIPAPATPDSDRLPWSKQMKA